VRTDGSRPSDYVQTLNTPWLAASYAYAPDQLIYASWGRGIESSVAPNRSRYTNAGESFTALSRQTEIGFKGNTENLEWSLAWFDIQRAQTTDIGPCDGPASCTTQLDGTAHHQGIDATATWRYGDWALRAGSMWLHARREGSQVITSNGESINGKEPTNVPALTLKLQPSWRVASIPGLQLQAHITHEGRRMALPDNSASIPSHTRVDTSLRFNTTVSGAAVNWRAGIDNLFNKRAWRESPYQFSHAYLYPLAPRTLRLSVDVAL
jgi:iron complex outermembrane recepter protein